MITIIKPDTVTNRFFCEVTQIKRGMIVSQIGISDELRPIVDVCQNAPNAIIGIALQSVAEHLNGFNSNHIRKGGKLEILTKGLVSAYFEPKLKLPIYQPIYVNLENSRLSWRKLGPKVGTVEEHKTSGNCTILVDFKDGGIC